MAYNEARKEATKRYFKTHRKLITLAFYPGDHDLYEKIKTVAEGEGLSAAAFTKDLLKKEIEKREKELL